MGAASSPDQSGVLSVGMLLAGRYRVESVLGTGGMGKVYKAEHTGIGRMVAVKVLHNRLGGSTEAKQRFQREAMASGRLAHPNIVDVSDSGELEDGSLYLVMEALEGEPLGARLAREKRIPWPEAILIIRAALAGLQHAHDKNVVHRDIKPDNIFLARKDGELVVKILDFGIAKFYAGDANDPASTRTGLTVGTPAYLSPEQAVGGDIKPASDLYSTSIVLYEMLTGRPPFTDDDPLAMLTAHVSRDAPPFAEVAPDLQVPPGLEELIQRGMAKLQVERITSANEYIAALDAIAAAAGLAVPMLPRVSGQVAVASGSFATPPHGTYATPMPGSYATPVPGSYATPVPGALAATGQVSYATPAPGALTSALDALTPMPSPHGELGTAATQSLDSLPRAARHVSLAEAASEPLPRALKLAAGAIILGAILVAVVLLLGGGSSDTSDGKLPNVAVPVDNATRLKAALHDLENGKTCADRKAAIPVLADVGGDEAIDALKRARYRMRGGVLGIGDSNTNACLKGDAERALAELGVTLR